MAGHSHWANIVHKKGAADKKRGKLFSKLSRAIIVAARNGGGDPDMNLRLRYAIDKARQASVPKDTIERAIKKGTGELEGESMDEVVYEGYGAGGVAVMAEALTDNRNRTAGEIKKIFERAGGNLGASGCVAYLFDRKGYITVGKNDVVEDTLMNIVLEAGAEDMRTTEDDYEIICDPTTFNDVCSALEEKDIPSKVSEITQLPQADMEVELEVGQRILRMMEALDEHDDVQSVYSNANFTDEMVATAQG